MTGKAWPRLPPSPDTCAKISASLKLRRKSKEHRSKISQALKGRPKTEEHRAKISQAMKLPLTPAQRKARQARRTGSRRREMNLRLTQLGQDLAQCVQLGNRELYLDVWASKGWRNRRTKFDDRTGLVSDGFAQGRIWWPFVRKQDGIA